MVEHLVAHDVDMRFLFHPLSNAKLILMINKSLETGSEKVNFNIANWSDSSSWFLDTWMKKINIGCIGDVNGLLIYKSRLSWGIWCVVVSVRFQNYRISLTCIIEKKMKNMSKQ